MKKCRKEVYLSSEAVWFSVKSKAAAEGISASEYIENLIQKDLECDQFNSVALVKENLDESLKQIEEWIAVVKQGVSYL